MTQYDGRRGSTRRCVVSCKNGDSWERMLLCAAARDDGVAAVYRTDWGQNWAIYYGHNLSAFGGLPRVTEWIVIHGPGGTDDIGNTQGEELKVIQDLRTRVDYQGKALIKMTIDEYEVLDRHDRCGACVTLADQDDRLKLSVDALRTCSSVTSFIYCCFIKRRDHRERGSAKGYRLVSIVEKIVIFFIGDKMY